MSRFGYSLRLLQFEQVARHPITGCCDCKLKAMSSTDTFALDVVSFCLTTGRKVTSVIRVSNGTFVKDVLKNFSHPRKGSTSKLDHYMICNGRRLVPEECLQANKIYHVIPRLVGGKGGFGSMLRAIGAQIEKTTSKEACRDLSGRRMRDINNEKKLKEWLAKEAEREKAKEERRAERLARQLNPPQHKFEDAQYQEQKAKVQEDLEDALQTGLKRALTKEKREADPGPSETKRAKTTNGSRKEWLGVDMDSDEDSDVEASPGPSSPPHTVQDAASSSQSPRQSPSSQTSALRVSPVKTEHTDPGDTSNTSDKKPASSLLSSLPPPTNIPAHSEVKQEPTEVKAEPVEGPIKMEDYPDKASLCALGLEKLKSELMARGLKCGGTLEERAARLDSVRGLDAGDYPPALLAKGKGKKTKS